jgi:hypothetical protein
MIYQCSNITCLKYEDFSKPMSFGASSGSMPNHRYLMTNTPGVLLSALEQAGPKEAFWPT